MPNRPPIPDFIFQSLEKHMIILFVGYSTFMLYVALMSSTDRWLFWKTIGFYIVFGIFALIEMIYLRVGIKKWQENERSRRILQQMYSHQD